MQKLWIKDFQKTIACNEEKINYIFAVKLFVTIIYVTVPGSLTK